MLIQILYIRIISLIKLFQYIGLNLMLIKPGLATDISQYLYHFF